MVSAQTKTPTKPEVVCPLTPISAAKYTVRFHDKFEEPYSVDTSDERPRSFAEYPNDWSLGGREENPWTTPQTVDMTLNYTKQSGWQISLSGATVVPPVLSLIFSGLTPGGNLSQTSSVSWAETVHPTIPANSYVKYVWAQRFINKTGSVSKWGFQGYEGDVPYSGTTFDGISVHGSIFGSL